MLIFSGLDGAQATSSAFDVVRSHKRHLRKWFDRWVHLTFGCATDPPKSATIGRKPAITKGQRIEEGTKTLVKDIG